MSDETIRILCVDDNEMNRLILEEALFEDYELAMAVDGEEALSLVESFQPHIVLLDVMMPGIDGYEVCRRLRARPENRDLIVIFCSAKAMTRERVAGRDAGGNDYITKPFGEEELRAKIEQHLDARRVAESADAGRGG